MNALAEEVIGEVTTLLEGSRKEVSTRQTNLGAVTCSALIDKVVNKTTRIAQAFPDAPVACLMNVGGLR